MACIELRTGDMVSVLVDPICQTIKFKDREWGDGSEDWVQLLNSDDFWSEFRKICDKAYAYQEECERMRHDPEDELLYVGQSVDLDGMDAIDEDAYDRWIAGGRP